MIRDALHTAQFIIHYGKPMKHALYLLAVFLLVYSFAQAGAPAKPVGDKGLISVNGTELYYEVVGKGTPILVLHGGPGLNHSYFLPQMKGLGKKCKLIFFDQRATGKSSMDVDTASVNLANFIEDIDAMREAFGLGQMNLMGHSFGGLLAMEYAIKHPDHLKSLILVASTAATSDYRNKAFMNMQSKTTSEDSAGQAQISQTEGFKNREPKTMAKFFRMLFRNDFFDPKNADKLTLTFDNNYAKSGKLLHGLNRDLANYDIHEDLKAVTCPTLVIETDHDRNLLEAEEQIKNSIPNAKSVMIKDSGHFPFIEQPAEFFKIVADFVNNN
jgi:proline iminopeptidase